MEHCHDAAGGGDDSDDRWVALCHRARLARTSRPSQSGFRVTAVVLFCGDGTSLGHVVGHNDEAVCPLNSCCAERAAFLHLSTLPPARCRRVVCVYLTSDAPGPIEPGMLCREFMLSSRLVRPDMRVVMDGGGRRVALPLRDLYPHPSPYLRLDSPAQRAEGERMATAEAMAHLRGQLSSAEEASAWERATAAAAGGDDGRALHPISYGACVLFADGTDAVARQWTALEYGASLDAVCLLTPAMEGRRRRGVEPTLLVFADQYGVCHAPYSAARAMLVEHGWGDLPLLACDDRGKVHRPTARDLMPGLPTAFGDFLRGGGGRECAGGRDR